jgi:hypothetical protein
MAEAVIGKRPYHAFLSHAHVDKAQADRLYDFLSRVAGFRVWYDTDDMPPGAAFGSRLYEAIESSRAAIILLSRNSVARGWVEEEYHAAQNQRANHKDFRVIPLRLDDVQPPGFLSNLTNIEIGTGELDAAAASLILQALYLPPRITPDPAAGQHTYFSRGWRAADAAQAEAVAAALCDTGLRLVGDAQDHDKTDPERIGGIMKGCGAFAAALPYRPSVQETTSTHVLDEWRLAVASGLPCLVIPHQDIRLPAEVRELPGLMPTTADAVQLSEYAENLAEEWRTPERAPYIFYATEFGKRELHRSVIAAVQAATGVPCILGEYVTGSPVQREILNTVSRATMVLANITGDSPNVYLETGAALASRRPVALLRSGPPGRPVFMLRDQQVHDYANDAELVGRAVRVAYPHRRFLQT